jgi:hypothetical protein
LDLLQATGQMHRFEKRSAVLRLSAIGKPESQVRLGCGFTSKNFVQAL